MGTGEGCEGSASDRQNAQRTKDVSLINFDAAFKFYQLVFSGLGEFDALNWGFHTVVVVGILGFEGEIAWENFSLLRCGDRLP